MSNLEISRLLKTPKDHAVKRSCFVRMTRWDPAVLVFSEGNHVFPWFSDCFIARDTKGMLVNIQKDYGKSQFEMGKSSISIAILHSCVNLPAGTSVYSTKLLL